MCTLCTYEDSIFMKLLVKSRPTRRIYNLPLTCTRNLHNKPRRLRKNHHYLNLLVKKQTKQQQQQTPRVFVIAIDISKCRDWYGTVSRYWCAHPSKWKIKERKKKRNHVSLHDFAESQQVLLADFLSLSFFFSKMLSVWLIFPSLLISACHKSWNKPSQFFRARTSPSRD